jgi:hypothetical protein
VAKAESPGWEPPGLLDSGRPPALVIGTAILLAGGWMIRYVLMLR